MSSDEEWRRGVTIIAEELLLRMAGYVNEEEFAKDGCRFVWGRPRSMGRAKARRRPAKMKT